MQLPPTDQLVTKERPIAPESRTGFWLVAASAAMHVVIAILLLVPISLPSLEATPEQPVALELIVEPEPEDEAGSAPEPEPEQPPEKPAEAPPPQPSPEPPSEDGKPEEGGQEPQLNILPNIAIRPEPRRLDAVDGDGEKPPEAPKEEETPVPSTEPAPEDLPDEPPVPEAPAGEGPATSQDGELPAGETPPLPQKKPPLTERETAQEQREPLSAAAIEGSGLRQIMGDLPPRRRLIQICSIEAVAQIRITHPNYARVQGLIPFSESGGLIDGGRLSASGGAFNMGGTWVEVDFTCEVDLERYRVTRFSQKIGRQLTRAEATERGFTKYE